MKAEKKECPPGAALIVTAVVDPIVAVVTTKTVDLTTNVEDADEMPVVTAVVGITRVAHIEKDRTEKVPIETVE